MDWTAVGSIGQWVGAIATFGGLLLVRAQVREAVRATDQARMSAELSRRSADLQALQKFFESVAERERALLRAPSNEEKQWYFNEYLDFLEISAAAVNNQFFSETTLSIVVDKLSTSIAVIESEDEWSAKFARAALAETTFCELRAFMLRERPNINARKREIQIAIKADQR